MAAQVRSNVQNWRDRALAALDVLRKQPRCDESNLAAIGYCFGGSTALQLAYAGADLKAVVTFHAALPAPTATDAQQIKPEILVCHGADDSFVAPAAIQAFKESLESGNVKYEFIAYPGARHSFTVPDADKVGNPGLKYNQKADEASWKEMQALFDRCFGAPK